MRTVEGAGVELAVVYESALEGPATVLVHGMGGTSWPLDALEGRVVLYDRRGYGDSGAPQPYLRTTVHEQAEDLAALIGALAAAPAVLVGADFGALVALDVALRRDELVHGVVLVDPPAYMFVPAAAEALGDDREALEQELRTGGDAALERLRPRLVDFGAIATLELGHAILRALAVPMVVVSTPRARAHDVQAARALVDATPAATDAPDVLAALDSLRG